MLKNPDAPDLNNPGALQIRSQELHLVQIMPGGLFVKLERLGNHLRPQDELLLAQQRRAEQDWHNSQVGLAERPGRVGRTLS